jgi:hypothetical protein
MKPLDVAQKIIEIRWESDLKEFSTRLDLVLKIIQILHGGSYPIRIL